MRLRPPLALLLLAACGGSAALAPHQPTATSAATVVTTSTTATTSIPGTPLPTVATGGRALAQATRVADHFEHPVLTAVRPGDDRLFVVDQPGLVWALEETERTLVLDLTADTQQGIQGGLVGLAFHPADPTRMFVYHVTPPGGVALLEYRLAMTPDSMATPVQTVLTFDRPAGFDTAPQQAQIGHYGGTVAFGPDGYLYLGVGDGGGEHDPFAQAQDPTTLWGSILRIDVDATAPYAIPADNPFAAGVDGAPEVWAWGLRNPYRISIDGTDLWIGDVGQERREEISRISTIVGGNNLGWPYLEGNRCHRGTAAQCADPTLTAPVHTYSHQEGCAVVGGVVYRGTALPRLQGSYLFGDFCTGEVQYLQIADDGYVRVTSTGVRLPGLTSIGADGSGELLMTAGTAVYRMVPPG